MRSNIHEVVVEFGHCDPAGIVFYPNYYRWFDAGTCHLFDAVGQSWKQLKARYGIIGVPLLEAHAKFLMSATFGETLQIESTIVEWGRKTFVVKHTVRRGASVLAEGSETRVFVATYPEDETRIKAVAVPEAVKAAFAG